MRRLLAWLVLLVTPALAAGGPTILVVGDSISAAHGVAVADGWVARLRARLEAEGYPHGVVNASVGGDTTSGGRARLPGALAEHDPDLVIIELGGNDGLRGQSLSAMADNLGAMVKGARAAGARVLLLGVRLPPNYGPAYTGKFTAVYERVAEDHDTALVPRMLAGVGERRAHMQADGIHPDASGHAAILDNVWPALVPLLEKTPEAAKNQP
jgi:acyl-CoA thioesterase-1